MGKSEKALSVAARAVAALNPFGNDVERAQGEITRLEGARAKLQAQCAQAQDEILALRAQLPAAELATVLDETAEPNATQIHGLIAQAERVIAAADRAEGPLLVRLQQAHADLAEAQAVKIDASADDLQADLDAHLRMVQELLAKLAELDGQYVSASSAQLSAMAFFTTGEGAKTLPPELQAIPITKGAQMQIRVTQLRAKAAAIRQQATVHSSGQASGYSLQELLEQLRQKPMAPTESSVTSWFASTQERATKIEADWQRLQGSTPMRLCWIVNFKGGVIDTRASSVSAEEQRVWRHGPLSQRAEVGGHAYTT